VKKGKNIMAQIKRPGGELASRPLHFIWIVDCSGSMNGDKIQQLNYAIRQTVPDMKKAADENPNAQLLVRTLKFSTGAEWMNTSPIPVEDFEWDDLEAGGLTELGRALSLVADQLTIPPMTDRALPPVLVLLSDGCPTDEYKESLERLNALPWGKKAVKIAISIGSDADDDTLKEFTGNNELVLQANNPQELIKMIKWASTLVKVVSNPNSQISGSAAIAPPLDDFVDVDSDEDVW